VNAALSVRAARAVDRTRTVSRSFYRLFQGPYTSVVLQDDPTSAPYAVAVSERVALAMGAVYRAVSIYGDLIGTMPVNAYHDRDKLGLPGFLAHPAGSPVGATDEIGQICWSLLLRGNAYLVPTHYGNRGGYPEAFTVLDPTRVTVTDAASGGTEYRYHRDAQGPDLIWTNPGPLELLHIRWQRPPGSSVGIGVLDANAYPGGTLSGAWATNYYAADLMRNPTPPAVLTHPARLNATQAADLQSQWSTSVGRARSVPAVLSGGITFQSLPLSARDAQLIESRRWNATDIATQFGLPPYMLGGSTGDSLTYATVEGEMIRLWTTALMPMTVRLERALSAWLPLGQTLRFNPDALLRSQTLDRYNAHAIALTNGFATLDEIRQLENRPPLADVDGGDEVGALSVAETLQKIYLAAGTVITVEEARQIAADAGADIVPADADALAEIDGGTGP